MSVKRMKDCGHSLTIIHCSLCLRQQGAVRLRKVWVVWVTLKGEENSMISRVPIQTLKLSHTHPPHVWLSRAYHTNVCWPDPTNLGAGHTRGTPVCYFVFSVFNTEVSSSQWSKATLHNLLSKDFWDIFMTYKPEWDLPVSPPWGAYKRRVTCFNHYLKIFSKDLIYERD